MREVQAQYEEWTRLRLLAAHTGLDALDAREMGMPITEQVNRQLEAYYLARCVELEQDPALGKYLWDHMAETGRSVLSRLGRRVDAVLEDVILCTSATEWLDD